MSIAAHWLKEKEQVPLFLPQGHDVSASPTFLLIHQCVQQHVGLQGKLWRPFPNGQQPVSLGAELGGQGEKDLLSPYLASSGSSLHVLKCLIGYSA